MVAVRVGDDHSVEAFYLGGQELLPQVRAAIDKHSLPQAFHQDRGSEAVVSGLIRVARLAISPHLVSLRR